MAWRHVKYSKGQFKIQQMVFILVAIIILFGIVSIFFVSIRFGSLRENVEEERKDSVIQEVRKISSTPEFAWIASDDCASCVDLDKIFLLKERPSYQDFWSGIGLLKVIRVHPTYETGECTSGTYPECNSITLAETDNFEGYEAFVSLCRYDGQIGQARCELGKIIMGFEGVDNG